MMHNPLQPIISRLERRSSSFRSIYTREVERGLARTSPVPEPPIGEAELARLPAPIRRYLRRAGVVGRPPVRGVRARFEGEMRVRPDADWMPVTAEQHSFFDEPARLYLVHGKRFGLPFEGLHIYSGASATMRVRVASILQVVDARGPEMDESETVTLFNDMFFLAPSALIAADVVWEALDTRVVRATFTNAGHTIRAEVSFDTDGALASFVSGDRHQSSDGKTYRRMGWETPIFGYRDFGGFLLPSRAEAIWHQPEGDLVYAHIETTELEILR